jgi:hypothetical protein
MAKTDWKYISGEITNALRASEPKPTKAVAPVVIIRESSLRTERAVVVLGRLA